jgi:hypothetical protein
VIDDVEEAANDCQNPGFACGNDIGDVIHVIMGLGAPEEAQRLTALKAKNMAMANKN